MIINNPPPLLSLPLTSSGSSTPNGILHKLICFDRIFLASDRFYVLYVVLVVLWYHIFCIRPISCCVPFRSLPVPVKSEQMRPGAK